MENRLKGRHLFVIVLMITILLIFGCDKHHAWGRIKLHHLPNNIEYIVGEKNSVDLSGMEIGFYFIRWNI